MQQWEYCYTIKGYVMYCRPAGDQTVRLEDCEEPDAAGAVAGEACIVARLGVAGWEAFAIDPVGRIVGQRPLDERLDAASTSSNRLARPARCDASTADFSPER